MPFADDVKTQLPSLNDEEKKNACEVILETLSPASHDALLKRRLQALRDDKAKADKRIRDVLTVQATVTTDDLRMAYKEYSDEMRHFSTVRSTLTAFLMTVSLAAGSAYFNKSQSHPFLIVAAAVFSLAALAVCLEFSRRTSMSYLRRKRIWDHLAKGKSVQTLDEAGYPSAMATLGTMAKDSTNYFLLIGLGVLVAAFIYRDSLSAILPTLP